MLDLIQIDLYYYKMILKDYMLNKNSFIYFRSYTFLYNYFI